MSGPIKVVKTKLFIGNLDPATQPGELTALFAPFGNVLEASVIKDYGFVHYGTIEEAEKAVVALNNKEFHGKRLRVELSTSTVRHRPGQPEPASALRNSRTRGAGITSGNGVSRYNPAAPPPGGVGPMRHSASAWIRSDTRPYDGVPMDPNGMAIGYGAPSSVYDRSRPYDHRSDPRSYYSDQRDARFGPGYDNSHDISYSAPGYSHASGRQGEMYPMRDYRDLQTHARGNGISYGGNRMYDRDPGASPIDPYYGGGGGGGGGGLPQGPPAQMDLYHNYDSYQKFYPNRPRDSEFSVSAGQNPASRDYNTYSNYRGDSYTAPTLRSDLSASYQQPHQQPAYPSLNQPRQQHMYGNTPGTPAASYPPTLGQYYGAQQRV